MKYAVVSPNNKLICFDHSDQVESYCMEKDNDNLNKYAKDQEFEYETMTPVEIGYAYTVVGAQSGGCRIYETRDILKKMKEQEAGEEMIQQMNLLFNNRRLNREIDCPGYLEDVLMELTPIHAAEMTDGVYICHNVDGASSERGNSGI